MDTVCNLIRPATLEEGREYSRIDQRNGGNKPSLSPVVFVSYTACPAIVIIIDGTGKRLRCLRDDLFLCTVGGQWEYSPVENSLASQAIKNDND